MREAWWPCQSHGIHAKEMEIWPEDQVAWRPSGMDTKWHGHQVAWRPYQKHGDHTKGMETIPKT